MDQTYKLPSIKLPHPITGPHLVKAQYKPGLEIKHPSVTSQSVSSQEQFPGEKLLSLPNSFETLKCDCLSSVVFHQMCKDTS